MNTGEKILSLGYLIRYNDRDVPAEKVWERPLLDILTILGGNK